MSTSLAVPFKNVDSRVSAQIHAIRNIDFSQEKRYMVNKQKVNHETAERLEEEFKRFLILCAVHRDSFPISKPVDEFWHVALLDSEKYARMEKDVGRRFIHRMTLSDEDDQKLLPLYYERTLPRYSQAFGEPANDMWPPNQCVCTCCDCIEA